VYRSPFGAGLIPECEPDVPSGSEKDGMRDRLVRRASRFASWHVARSDAGLENEPEIDEAARARGRPTALPPAAPP